MSEETWERWAGAQRAREQDWMQFFSTARCIPLAESNENKMAWAAVFSTGGKGQSQALMD